MTFAEWVDQEFKKPEEPLTSALYRLNTEWGVSYKSLFYAHHGARVTPTTARLIEEKTGGRVLAAVLVMLPTRAELADTKLDEAV